MFEHRSLFHDADAGKKDLITKKYPITKTYPILLNDFGSIFDEIFRTITDNKQKTRDLFKSKMDYPKTDIYLNDVKDMLCVEMSVPGLKKEDLEITLENKILTIKGNKKETSEINDVYYVKELKKSAFTRSWELPDYFQIDDDKETKSCLEDGILNVKIPLVTEKKDKKRCIEIK